MNPHLHRLLNKIKNIYESGINDKTTYQNKLKLLASGRDTLNIVQIGANDGKYNDPIYDFVRRNKDITNIVLVEPIAAVIPYLKENYDYHPSVEIYNKAISGSKDGLRLYGVKKEYWGDISTDYGEDWPDYRIPTGVTTANREQLEEWIIEYVMSEDELRQIIEEFDVDLICPKELIEQSEILNNVDLLQVDAEGMDDEVVYSFLEDGYSPTLINIENRYLTEKQIEKYEEIVRKNGYRTMHYSKNEILSIKNNVPNGSGAIS